MSFVPVLQQIKASLEHDAALQLFCQVRFGKSPTVGIKFRKRQEIKLQDLPVLFITRPSRSRGRVYGDQLNDHRVAVYGGFLQNDADQGLLDLIAFEEAIVAALESDTTLEDMVEGVSDQDILNDEGSNHPAYFTSIDFEIKTR